MTNQKTVIDQLIQKTHQELNQPERPKSRSRVWESPNGYIYLVAWSNACLLRVLVSKWFSWFRQAQLRGYYRNLEEIRGDVKGDYRNLKDSRGKPASSKILQHPLNSSNFLSPKLLDRLEAQLLDSLRSSIANIEEGYARPTTSEYLQFLGYSQASLKEAKGDGQRLNQDGYLPSVPGSSLADLGIDLKDWHEALKKSVISSKGDYRNLEEVRGNYRNLEEFKFGYSPVDNFKANDLTYEILIELINKTDWHLRRLVESLEKKLDQEQKGYQIEQALVRNKLNPSASS